MLPPLVLGSHHILSNLSLLSTISAVSSNPVHVGNNKINNGTIHNNPEICKLLDEDDDEKENSFSKVDKDNKKKMK